MLTKSAHLVSRRQIVTTIEVEEYLSLHLGNGKAEVLELVANGH